MARRAKRTPDPQELAEHLAANIQEIAEYARAKIGNDDPKRILISLGRLQDMMSNMRGECAEHQVEITDARAQGRAPMWDVLGEDEREEALTSKRANQNGGVKPPAPGTPDPGRASFRTNAVWQAGNWLRRNLEQRAGPALGVINGAELIRAEASVIAL